MINTVIIDDEANSRFSLYKLIETHFEHELKIIGEADGIEKGFQLIMNSHPDLVFLDVEMPDGTGFDLLERIPYQKYKIIFTTGHGQYALKAFRYSAIDYLLKPIDINELKHSIAKISSTSFLNEMNKKIEILLGNRTNFEKVALPCRDGVELIHIKNIIRCESESNYTRFFTNDGKSLLVTKSLKDYEEILELHGFFRSHKSHLINLNFIKKYIDGEGGMVNMEDGSLIPVSRRRKKDLLDILLK